MGPGHVGFHVRAQAAHGRFDRGDATTGAERAVTTAVPRTDPPVEGVRGQARGRRLRAYPRGPNGGGATALGSPEQCAGWRQAAAGIGLRGNLRPRGRECGRADRKSVV